jgi:hypothetical protein
MNEKMLGLCLKLKTKIASCNILFAFKGKLHKMLTANK